MPQPPETDPSLEGQNCICCFAQKSLKADKRDLNSNKVCKPYKEMCQDFNQPLDYPQVIHPEKPTYQIDPVFEVPPCQKVVFPPEVPNPLSLEGKNVLVIGGSKGNGKAIAKRFRDEGANVIATSRHPHCYKKPKGYQLKQLDVRFEEEVKSFITYVAKDCFGGKIDILVNCPIVAWRGPLAEATGNDLMNFFESAIAGYQRTTHYALPYMRHSNETRVISIGSLSAYTSVAYAFGPYVMAKLALQGWNDLLQVEDLMKKSQGLIEFGPTFSLLETSVMKTTIGLYEQHKASTISDDNPLFIGGIFRQQWFGGAETNPTALIGEAAYRVAAAPQPGVRYAVVGPDESITLPDGSKLPVLDLIQLSNLLSPDAAINNIYQPFNFARAETVQEAKDAITEQFCPEKKCN